MIEQVRRGQILFPNNVSEGVMPFSNLSDPELIALRCLVRNGNLDTVAAALMIERGAARLLRGRLLTKLGLSTDEELIRFDRYLKLS